jgi:3-deoxy-D-manno-octulosonate 8-phosphate phosphatase (KDO 8-P phosphatase)
MTHLKALVFDVDGVLTDGGVWWGPQGEEWKRFSFIDIMAVSLAIKAGLIVGLISGEDSPLVDRFAAKLGIVDVARGCKDKASALRAFAGRHGLAIADVAFMGDDVNDLEAMKLAGVSATTANAVSVVRDIATFVSERPGGQGAVRDFVDMVLRVRTAPRMH